MAVHPKALYKGLLPLFLVLGQDCYPSAEGAGEHFSGGPLHCPNVALSDYMVQVP